MDEFIDDTVECPLCGGAGEHVGVLGSRAHFRCRACGMYHSIALSDCVTAIDSTDEDDDHE